MTELEKVQKREELLARIAKLEEKMVKTSEEEGRGYIEIVADTQATGGGDI